MFIGGGNVSGSRHIYNHIIPKSYVHTGGHNKNDNSKNNNSNQQ